MDQDGTSLPPTPSPAPRLRRSPKRHALHDRTSSHTNQILFPTIRPVTDPDAKVYATSPFPNSVAQLFPPPGPRRLLAAVTPRPRPSEPQQPTNTTNFATPDVRGREEAAPFINAPSPPQPLGLFSHNGPRLEPAGVAHTRSFSYPPGEVQEDSAPYTPSSAGTDVDRLAMVENPSNVNDARTGASSYLAVPTPSSHPTGYGSQSSPYTPQMSSSSTGHGLPARRSGLEAIASVASNLTLESTPQSAGTAGSGGTVIRNMDFSGAIPPGFYARFPPDLQQGTPDSRIIAAPPRRRSSAPPRPVSEGPLSPIESGADSPVSPVSSEAEDAESRKSSLRYPRHQRSRSDDFLTPGSRGHPIPQFASGSSDPEPQSATSSLFALYGQTHTIPRKPVSRSNAVRWNSYMSTIPSESEARTSSGLAQITDETRRSSRAVPEGMAQPERDSEASRSSESIDFATLRSPFPMPEPLFLDKLTSRQRVSGGTSARVVSGAELINRPLPRLPPQSSPPARDSRQMGSPTSVYSRGGYRDSGVQTSPSKRGSLMFLRESIPAWARYSQPFSNGQPQSQSPSRFQIYNEPVYYPPEHALLTPNPLLVVPDSLTCPNCSARWKPEPSPDLIQSLNQPNLDYQLAVPCAAAKRVKANRRKRVYYADERRHRDTIGRPSSGLSSGSSRRHTIGSLTDSFRFARNRRSRQESAGQHPRGLRPIRPPRPATHDRPMSMPITPATPATPYDPSIFVGEQVRGPARDTAGAGWSPHLWHNRRSAIKRRTLFQAPSIDEEAEGKGLTRRNLQIWFFALGFILPFLWIVGGLSPLPVRPRTPPTSPAFERDLEKALGPVDQARYENARWWRNINRIMSVVGVGVIIAIIVLAVTASRSG
ncbi:MAG: hypothetical protein LQ340_002589 [Diploschistes diacapsis]|nr:MAG: hypothetical protein LQ340_002589 [Diploschistes diacapsis]